MVKYVRVSQDDIKRGVKHDPCFCPIARALKRNFPKLADADLRVTGAVHYTTSAGKEMRADLTDKARSFIADFDRGRKVDPLWIGVELPFEIIN